MLNRTYYLTANSYRGYTSFFDICAGSMRKIIALKNITKDVKKLLFNKIIAILEASDISYDVCLRCGTVDEIDAVILNNLSSVIAHTDLFAGDIPLYADTVDFSPHLALDFETHKILETVKNQIRILKDRMYSHLNDAKLIHDSWEKIYISNMDFDAMDKAGLRFINEIFADESISSHSKVSNGFFGTLLPRGNVNYINDLTKDIERRIFIKGRPGTGKSTFLKKIVSAAEKNGCSTEVYYCSFDPKSLDMVIIRELGVALFDSTAPHEIFPERAGDEVFDIYDIAVRHDTDNVYADELMHITSQYNQSLKKAKECLYTCHMLEQKYDKIISNNTEIEKSIDKVISLAALSY